MPTSTSRGVPIALLLATLAAGAACRSAAPLAGAEARPAAGTISGHVTGPEGIDPVAGRVVEAVEVDTQDLYSAETGVSGSYSIEVPPGRYRLRVVPAGEEVVVRSPHVVRVGSGELVTDADFVLAGAGVVEK